MGGHHATMQNLAFSAVLVPNRYEIDPKALVTVGAWSEFTSRTTKRSVDLILQR